MKKNELLRQVAEDILPYTFIEKIGDYDLALNIIKAVAKSNDLANIAINIAAIKQDCNAWDLDDMSIESTLTQLIDARGIVYDISLKTGSYWKIVLQPQFVKNVDSALAHYIFPVPTAIPYKADINNSVLNNRGHKLSGSLIERVINKQNSIAMTHSLQYGIDIKDKETWYAEKAYQCVPSEFHFDHKIDFRGRLYNDGYDITYQGTTAKKAQISFVDDEPLTERGMRWLKIDIANHYGKDKLTFDERVKWFDDNYPFTGIVADETQLAVKAINMYEGGKHTHIYLDATASFLQIYSILLGDKRSAELCNIASGENRADIYTMVANDMDLKRSDVKKPLMTMSYGKKPISDTENMIFEKLQELAPGMIKGMDSIYKSRPEKDYHNWTLPDGFKVHMLEFDDTKKRDFNTTISGKKYTFSYNVKPQRYKTGSRALAPNVIHSIDGYIVRRMIDELPFKITTIHDSFACHPNNADEMIAKYREILIDLFHTESLLSDILSEIAGKPVKAPYIGTLTEQDIRESVHILS